MSNSVFQGVISQLKEISDRTFGVIDTDGYVISSTDASLLGERWQDAAVSMSGRHLPVWHPEPVSAAERRRAKSVPMTGGIRPAMRRNLVPSAVPWKVWN